jgi:hypothetical protein
MGCDNTSELDAGEHSPLDVARLDQVVTAGGSSARSVILGSIVVPSTLFVLLPCDDSAAATGRGGADQRGFTFSELFKMGDPLSDKMQRLASEGRTEALLKVVNEGRCEALCVCVCVW